MKPIQLTHWLLALTVATLIHLMAFSQLTRKQQTQVAPGIQSITFNLTPAYSASLASGKSTKPLQAKPQQSATMQKADFPRADLAKVSSPIIKKEVVKPERIKKPEIAKIKRTVVKKSRTETKTSLTAKQKQRSASAPEDNRQVDTIVENVNAEQLADIAPITVESMVTAQTTQGHQSESGNPAGSPNITSGVHSGRQQRKYAATLLAWITKHKRYPKRARRKGQEGMVELTFTVNSVGQLLSQKITKSSGYTLLDDETKKMLIRALPFPRIPANLGRDELTFNVPVSFALR